MPAPSIFEPPRAAPAVDLGRVAASLETGEAAADFSDEEVEGFHAVGQGFVLQGHHRKALSFLVLAAHYRPAEPRYVLALGLCRKALQQHLGAVQAFAELTKLEPQNPEPGLLVAECLLAVGREEEAEQLLETVIECAWASPDGRHARVRDRADALLQLLDRKLLAPPSP